MATSLDMNGRWSAIGVGTNLGATATQAAVAGKTFVIDHISGHTDKDSTLQLKDGSTVLAEWALDISLEGFRFYTTPGIWVATTGAAVTAVISDSTSDCAVNIAGFTLP
jgi:hypothetical protein